MVCDESLWMPDRTESTARHKARAGNYASIRPLETRTGRSLERARRIKFTGGGATNHAMIKNRKASFAFHFICSAETTTPPRSFELGGCIPWRRICNLGPGLGLRS